MSKEYLEALNDLFDLVTCQGSFEKAQRCFDIVEQALQRLESIDNAEPSEALECLEALEQDIKDRVILAEDRQLKLCAVIKQALLKAQEPKQYLKWEDLKFTEENKIMEVLLNGVTYNICFYEFTVVGQNEVNIYTNGTHIVTLNSYYPEDIKFFNHLHLEVLE